MTRHFSISVVAGHRRLATAIVGVVMLTLAATALAAKPVRVRLAATDHKPKVGRTWTATVTATSGSSAASGAVSLDVLFGGKVVYHVATGRLSGGAYRKTVQWPLRAVGYPLTMRARVRSRGAAHDDFYAFRVYK